MTEEQIALARRAVACRGWRWMPGMLTVGNDRVLRVTSNSYDVLYDVRANVMVRTLRIIDPPDLEDPATLGCLLALVREAWWQDDMGASRYKDQWCVDVTPQEAPNYAFYAFYGASEAEALVVALEGAS